MELIDEKTVKLGKIIISGLIYLIKVSKQLLEKKVQIH